MRKRLFITLFLCLNSLVVFAQIDNSEASHGSVYTQFGVGAPVDYGSSGADGLGLWGVSNDEPLVPNNANPAIWGNTIYGMGTGGIGIDNYHAEDNVGSAKHSLLYINQFQLQLPIYRGKLGVSASFSPFTRVSYKTIQSGQRVLQNVSSQDVLNYKTADVGDGGISQYELGIGWKITPNISIGYGASLVHGSIDNSFTTAFDTTIFGDGNYSTVNTTLQSSASGFGNRFGAYFTLPSVLRKKDQLNLGIVIRLPVTITGRRVQESQYVSGDPEDPNNDIEQKLGSGHINLPLGLTAGLTYQPSQRVALSAEGRFEKWSDYENTIDPASGAGVIFTDRLKVGTGLQFNPFLSGSDKFLSQFKYRFGASYDSGYLKINGENVETLMLSAGLGIISPTKVQGFNSSVDISFHYGIRGTKSQNLVKESIWGVKLSVNLSELFFFRPKLR